jgi:rare lipoprotein A
MILRLALVMAITLSAPVSSASRSAPVIPASSGAMLRQDQARSGTPKVPASVAPSGMLPARVAGVPLMAAEGRVVVPVRLPAATHVEAGGRVSSWQRVLASSYGIHDPYLGRRMACGGVLDNVALVVAHRTLPCGTRVQICFKRSSGTFCATATVRDRGPYVAGRIFDLGPAVARAVHFSGLGWIRWRLK